MWYYGAHQYSRRAQLLIRIVFALMYLGGAVMGFGASVLATYPPESIADGVVQALGAVALIVSLTCCVAVIAQRWKVEWIGLFFLNGAISVYLVIIWGEVGADFDRLTSAGAFTMLNFSLLVRLIDLTLAYSLISRTAFLKRKVITNDAE